MQEISKLEGLYLLETSKDFYISRCNLSFHQHLEDLSSGGARSRNLGGHLGGKLIFWGGKIEFLKRYCYTATGGRIS